MSELNELDSLDREARHANLPGFKLLQIGNVGQIVGGTAACAWTVTRCLPECDHAVAFLGPISADTRRAFAGCELHQWPVVSAERIDAVQPDVVLLHNTSPQRVRGRWNVPTVQYAHSHTPLARAEATVYCSEWLVRQFGASLDAVCWQGVPQPPQPGISACRASRPDCARVGKVSRTLGSVRDAGTLVVGRICTPTGRKWPPVLVPFYRELATRCPFVRWEFVGCPRELQPALATACRHRATFTAAAWERRDRYAAWDALLYHHPTLTESFGRTVAEALLAGCVPVVDRRGGFCEQLAEGGGRLCDTVDEFATALHALRDPVVRQVMAQRGEQCARERWSLEAFAHRLRTLLSLRRGVPHSPPLPRGQSSRPPCQGGGLGGFFDRLSSRPGIFHP